MNWAGFLAICTKSGRARWIYRYAESTRSTGCLTNAITRKSGGVFHPAWHNSRHVICWGVCPLVRTDPSATNKKGGSPAFLSACEKVSPPHLGMCNNNTRWQRNSGTMQYRKIFVRLVHCRLRSLGFIEPQKFASRWFTRLRM